MSLSEAKTVRDYLIKNYEHVKENAWRNYSELEVKEFKSMKSILSRRSQFNDDKQEFHNQLKKKFPMSSDHQNQLAIMSKGDHHHHALEKSKKRF